MTTKIGHCRCLHFQHRPSRPSTVSDVDSADAAKRISTASIVLSVEHITFSAMSATPHGYLPTVLAYSARLQGCSTSHPTSANHLHGGANPHPSRETTHPDS